MRWDGRAWAGAGLFAGAAEFLTLMVAAESIAPDYSMKDNAISDLGVGTTAVLFNASIVIAGLLTLAAAYLYYRAEGQRLVAFPLLLAGIGGVGVGLFPETTGAPHALSAFVAFVFGNLTAILAYRVERPPLRFVSPILGVMGLVALVLATSGTYLGLGFGGMERMIVYPFLLWAVAFGGSLMTPRSEEPTRPVIPQS